MRGHTYTQTGYICNLISLKKYLMKMKSWNVFDRFSLKKNVESNFFFKILKKKKMDFDIFTFSKNFSTYL